MKTVLITGVNGYIGKVICNELKKVYPDYYIIGIDVVDNSDLCNEYYSVSLGKDKIPDNLYDKKIDYIIHAAAVIRSDDMNLLIQANYQGTKQIAEFAKKIDVEKIYYISSVPNIGKPAIHPINEEHPCNPGTNYHKTKYLGEQALQEVIDDRAVMLRIPSPIHPSISSKSIFPIFVTNAYKNIDINITGKGTRRQNYLDVRDLAQLIVNSFDMNDINGLYLVGSEKTISNVELAELCIKLTNSKSKIIYSGKSDPSDDEIWDLDLTKVKDVLGYKQKYTIEDTINDFIKEIKK